MGIAMIKQFQCDKCGNLNYYDDYVDMPLGWTIMDITSRPYDDAAGARFVLCKQCHDYLNRWMQS